MNRLLIASTLALAACGGTDQTGTGTSASTGTSTTTTASSSTGSTASSGYAPTLVTLTGSITQSTLPRIPAHVRVAMVWPTATADQEAESVDVDLSSGTLPIRYFLNIGSPPPAASMQRVPSAEATADGIDPSTFQFAVGNVIAYVDANGNGKRDLDGTEQIIATPDTVVYYVDGGPAPAIAATGGGNREDSLPVGFSLLLYQPGGDNGVGGTTPAGVAVTPISSDIDLELEPTTPPGGLLCATGFGADATVSTATQPEEDETLPPAGAEVFCSSDGEIYFWSLCTGNICGETCTAGSGQLTSSTPTAGYPCPLNPAS